MKLKDITKIKGREVFSVKPGAGLAEAVDKLVKHNIGALPVCEADGKLAGILSERDILKWVYKGKTNISSAKVKDIMTKDVVVGSLEDEIEGVLKKMSEKGVRHLPIISGDNIVGMLSLRDVIEEQLNECNLQVRNLHDYISPHH